MPLTQLLPWLLTAVVASVAGLVSGVHSGLAWLSWASAMTFAAALIATSLEINTGWWQQGAGAGDPEAAQLVALRNMRLITVAYMWGALAMLSVYRLAGIRWQHGIQYGAGMAVITFLLMGYAHALSKRGTVLASPRALVLSARIAWLHACACLGGLTFLVGSGKLLSSKGDWAANQVFLAGGIAMMVLSAIAAYTQQRLNGSNRPREAHSEMVPDREHQGSH